MKNHIAFKFLAVLLCTLSLFLSIVSVIGIAVAEQGHLYSENIPAVIQKSQEQILSGAAKTAAGEYLSQALGGCPDRLVAEYYRNFAMNTELVDGTWGYELRAPDGTFLYCSYLEDRDSLTTRDYQISTHYLMLVEAPVPADAGYNDPYGDHQPMLQPTVAPTDATSPTTDSALPEGSYGFIYWDNEAECYLQAKIRDVYLEGYSVTLYFSEKSFANRDAWVLAQLVWSNRHTLFWSLGISLLLFAITAVYLCCAAGRKPGSDEIKAGGFNAIPLDLYLVGTLVLLWLDYEVAEELVKWFSLSNTGLVFVAVCAVFVPSLLFVSFCFACAAQFKEGGGRWWRKSVIGCACRGTWWLICRVVLDFCPWLAQTGWKAVKALFRFARNIITITFVTFRDAVLWVLNKVAAGFWWVGSKVERVFSLLPLTWQWILLGTAMVTVLFLGILSATRRYDPLGLLVSLGLCLGLVLYGAHAFGILLEGAKRMRQGDLDNKISDRLLLGAFRDFAGDLNALAQVAKAAAQKEMKSERMKTELITNVSHDIKTPLTSIINYVDLLQKPHTPEEEAQYLEVLDRKAQQLKKLIQDLMEMSKASTGNMAVTLEQVDAAETVTQALGEFSDKLAQSRLTPVFTPPAEKFLMQADGRLVWRVLNNLLSNAVKYAMPGTRLYVDLEKNRDRVSISLKNISAEPLNVDAEELMERFVRGDASRNSEGSGLGLNIARSLMEVQGGTLELAVDGDLFKATLSFPTM